MTDAAPGLDRRWPEVTTVRIALAVVAVHVADEAFLRPARGTSAADHLAAGLVPLAAVLALAVAYPRARAGARGALAVVFGALAVTAGLVAGPLSLVAGVALLASGAVVLWRSRRTRGPRTRRWLRRAGLTVAALVFAVYVLLPVGVAIVATHAPPARVLDLGARARDVTLRTSDRLHLAASYVPSRNGAAVIVFPGRDGPAPHARLLVRHGYGVLLLDRRGEGSSDGAYNAYGWGGERDLVAALAYLRRQPDVDRERIGGLGLSVGGELLLQTAAEHGGLRAVVSEGAGIRSLAEQRHTDQALNWLTPWAVQTAALAVLSGEGPPPDLVDLMPRIAPHPVLLIQAEHGTGGEELNRTYRDAAAGPAELWRVPGAEHTGALSARPHEYERRVIRFLDSALAPRGA